MAFICMIILYGGFRLSTKNIIDVDLSKKVNVYKYNSDVIEDLIEYNDTNNSKYKEYIEKNYRKGVLSYFVNDVTKTNSVTFSLLNSVNKFLGGKLSVAIVIVISNIIILFRIFFVKVLEIGKNRYFLEERRYKTELDRSLIVYRNKKNFKLSIILLKKDIYLFLWCFTIIGFFIKFYEYSMISYILAENPNIKSKDAFRLSKELTNGEKFNLFKLDLYILLYKIIGLFTLIIFNIFYTNVYKETLYSEVYINLRRNNKDSLLSDDKLDIDNIVDSKYPDEYKKKSLIDVNYDKEYSISSYVLLFFTFSFIGWSWEVVIHLIRDGMFVNRGTMYGPWLSIYGWGGLVILILLKRYRSKPWKLFVMSVVTCGLIEYFTALYLEVFLHLRYMNYNGYFLNIKGRVCLEGLIFFGFGGMVFTYLLAPLLDNLFNKIKYKRILCICLVGFYLIDFIYTSQVEPNTGVGVSKPVIVEKKS